MNHEDRIEPTDRTPAAVIEALIAGNARYAAGRLRHPHQAPRDREAQRTRHRPIAAIVACSDARVPPSVVLDQGLGDLFTVRIAGHVVGDDALASVHYAVQALEVPVVLVIGHRSCGAVGLALDALRSGGPTDGPLLRDIAAAARAAIDADPDGDRAAQHDDAVLRHADATAGRLAADRVVRARSRSGLLTVRAGRYDLASGRIEGLEREVAPATDA
ncbi:MAG: carbonic anhydrase [Trueperaceae bacterium]